MKQTSRALPGVEPVSVVLPTIGRPKLIRSCLASLAACEPRADEILVVDSSEDSAVAQVVADYALVGATLVRCTRAGLGFAFNVGLREARHEVVLLTNDDCTVDPAWVAAGLAHVAADTIVTGRVRPAGDPDVVPSTIDDPVRKRYSGRPAFVLYTQSMAFRRADAIAVGGFDERIRPSAEDNDLAYRWLRTGRSIVYEPDFVVWHRDWRSREQLARLYVDYGIGQGMVYAKHLRRGDLRIARFVVRDLYAICRGLADRVVRGRRPHGDWRLGLARGLPVGFLRGWQTCGPHTSGVGLLSTSAGQRLWTPQQLERARRSRRHARPTQFDYLHLRRLVDDLARALAEVEGPVRDVLDVFCGSRPYDDLLPPGARCVGLDVEGNPYNVADVVSNEFLPFEDASFDLVTCIEAFQYVEDAEHGTREMWRVLRPGGAVLVSLPFAWEYDRSFLEHRYTGPELAHLFRDWDDVRVVENGGRGVVWTTLTATVLERFRLRLPAPARLLFVPLYLGLNAWGSVLDRLERRHVAGTVTLPMNLLLTARRPLDD